MSTTQKTEDKSKESLSTAWQDPAIAERYARNEAATRPYADILLDKASVVTSIKQHNTTINALDFGCGTGAVTAALYSKVPRSHWPNVQVLGGDISQPMLTYLQNRGEQNGWPGLTTQLLDGTNLHLAPNQFTHVFANAIIFFLPLGALAKLFHSLQPRGYIGITTWAAINWYPLVERAINSLPNPPPLLPLSAVRGMMQQNNAWHEPGFVRQQLEEAGFADVDVVVEKRIVELGTPEQFCESLRLPLMMFESLWEEGRKEVILEEVMRALRRVMGEEAGEAGKCYMAMEWVVGSGWKPSVEK
ncbi:S-adenosyl-L-methionine-dependent methyltransferase [Karstenula rhodostoma CBS 690.94]|uniref:S-adenosyl-L-methionine-dependent methyltransferase n=1 Tax=Karstenula rhodostoma CBS 690.94 TaxID=1392251 RepID=A0A9P4P9V9_9PLEO|nr:S-adenosyl-L-methionine-dependent methyltransferase [Karstenula rhodostoma CBS 690.94]